MKTRFRFFDNIHRNLDPIGECEEKHKFEANINRLSNVIHSIAINVSCLTTIYDIDEKELQIGRSLKLNSLQSMLLYNTWGMTILQLNTLLEQKGKDDSISLSSVIAFASQNRERIYSIVKQEARVPAGIEVKEEHVEWKTLPSKNIQEVINHCNNLLDEIEPYKQKLRIIRNKVYAHNSEQYSTTDSRSTLLHEISLVDVKRIQAVAVEIVDSLSEPYNGSKYHYSTVTISKETQDIFKPKQTDTNV